MFKQNEVTDILQAIDTALTEYLAQFDRLKGDERADMFFLIDRVRRLRDKVALLRTRN